MYVKKMHNDSKKTKKTNAITSTFPKSAFQLHWETKYLTWLPTTSSNPGAHVKSKVLRHKVVPHCDCRNVHPTTTTPKSKNSNKNSNKSNRDDDDNNNNNNNNNIINNIDNMI